MKATRGNVHDCLGMTFRFKDGKAKIDMLECLKNVLKEFSIKSKEMNMNMAPAGVDSFIKDLSKKLSREMKGVFH